MTGHSCRRVTACRDPAGAIAHAAVRRETNREPGGSVRCATSCGGRRRVAKGDRRWPRVVEACRACRGPGPPRPFPATGPLFGPAVGVGRLFSSRTLCGWRGDSITDRTLRRRLRRHSTAAEARVTHTGRFVPFKCLPTSRASRPLGTPTIERFEGLVQANKHHDNAGWRLSCGGQSPVPLVQRIPGRSVRGRCCLSSSCSGSL